MSVICAVLWALGVWLLFKLICFLTTDSDLVLQWANKFGKNPATLKGSVVWLTGASSGIGESLAYELVKAGCKVILSSRRLQELERVKAECHARSNTPDKDILVLPLDVVEFESHKPALSTILQRFSKIDILICCAGQGMGARFLDIVIDTDRRMYELNTLGPISLARAVIPSMIENNGGRIAVISSLGGLFGFPYTSSYAAAKHAVNGAFECLRYEMYPHNISVTTICPGYTESNFMAALQGSSSDKKVSAKLPPVMWPMESERCAHLTLVAIANNLGEVWIAVRPFIYVPYLFQFFPTTMRWLMTMFSLKGMQAPKDV